MDRVIDKNELAGSVDTVLADIRRGRTVALVDDGALVARIVPTEEAEQTRRVTALKAFLEHVSHLPSVVIGPWTREELYERERWSG